MKRNGAHIKSVQLCCLKQMSLVQFPPPGIKQKIRMLQSCYSQWLQHYSKSINTTEVVYGAAVFQRYSIGVIGFFLSHAVEWGWKPPPFHCPFFKRRKVTNVVCKAFKYFRDRNCKGAAVHSFPEYFQLLSPWLLDSQKSGYICLMGKQKKVRMGGLLLWEKRLNVAVC